MKFSKYQITLCLCGLGSLLLTPATTMADPPDDRKIERESDRGLQLDIGRFTPLRLVDSKLTLVLKTGKRSVNVKYAVTVTSLSTLMRVNEQYPGPAYAERPGQPTEIPPGDYAGG
ncbi:MAG: hypothetical protein R3C11_09655 [Planctomycetaceae bacterium]